MEQNTNEVDPETDYRDWRYSWEKPWTPGLRILQLLKEDQQKLRSQAEKRKKTE